MTLKLWKVLQDLICLAEKQENTADLYKFKVQLLQHLDALSKGVYGDVPSKKPVCQQFRLTQLSTFLFIALVRERKLTPHFLYLLFLLFPRSWRNCSLPFSMWSSILKVEPQRHIRTICSCVFTTKAEFLRRFTSRGATLSVLSSWTAIGASRGSRYLTYTSSN